MHLVDLLGDVVAVVVLEHLLDFGGGLRNVGDSLHCLVDLGLYLILVSICH